MHRLPQRLPQKVILLVLVSGLLLGASRLWPAASLAASSYKGDDLLGDFAGGNFQRTALSDYSVGGFNDADGRWVEDQAGAVQLSSVGIPNKWESAAFFLPQKLTQFGACVLGNRIFVLGGQATPTNGGTAAATDKVWSVPVSQKDGSPPIGNVKDIWQSEKVLLPVQHSNSTEAGYTDDIGPIYAAAVTSVVTNTSTPNSGFIYVLGGTATVGTNSFSSYAVRVATVKDGKILNWQKLDAEIPGITLFDKQGLESPAVTSATIGGKTYLYLFGGQKNNGTVKVASKTTFWALVDPASGKLLDPDPEGNNVDPTTESWGRLESSGTNAPAKGFWNALAVASTNLVSQTTQVALYVIGGETADGAIANVYRATVSDEKTGKLEWDWSGTLPNPRTAHSGAEINGTIFVSGGMIKGETTPTTNGNVVLSSYVQDNLELPKVGGTTGSNFYASENALPQPRAFHQSVVVQGTEGLAFLYTLGGKSDSGPSDLIFTAKIQKTTTTDASQQTNYANNGWFFSRAFDFTNPALGSWDNLAWATELPAGTDIEMAYRFASSCTSPTWSQWKEINLDPDNPGQRSESGWNVAKDLQDGPSTMKCFQYRAYLKGSSDASSTVTPLLLNVFFRSTLAGSADLWVEPELTKPRWLAGQKDVLQDLDIVIKNEMKDGSKTEELSAVGGQGDFFVDLLIFGPGTQALTPTIPLSNTIMVTGTSATSQTVVLAAPTRVYTNISKSAIKAGEPFKIGSWCDSAAPKGCQEKSLVELLPKAGLYTATIMVDSYISPKEWLAGQRNGYVSEYNEKNNLANLSFTVSMTYTPPIVMLVTKDGATAETGAGKTPKAATFLVERSTLAAYPLTVTYKLEGSATDPTGLKPDYTLQPTPTGQVVIKPNETQAFITLSPIDDSETEQPETGRLILQKSDYYKLNTIYYSATATIQDNDDRIGITTNKQSLVTPTNTIVVTQAVTLSDVFVITRSASTDLKTLSNLQPLTVTFSISGTAVSGKDFTFSQGGKLLNLTTTGTSSLGTIIFPAGVVSTTLTLNVQDSSATEDRNLVVILNSGANYTVESSKQESVPVKFVGKEDPTKKVYLPLVAR